MLDAYIDAKKVAEYEICHKRRKTKQFTVLILNHYICINY
jgi:hypothetical protein